jgi:DUF1680 family protein
MPVQSPSRPVVVDTSQSPYARLRPLPLTAVTLDDEFWAPRRRLNRQVTIPSQYRHCEATGRIDNFRRAAGQVDLPFQGRYYNDSDVYKWLEGVAWTLATDADSALAEMADAVIDAISAAQRADGYLNTYFSRERATERWTNLRDMHELYCAGHLIQAAIAHRRATGGDRLFQVARRLADHICGLFGPQEQGKRPGAPGHQEIEMALVELARETGDQAYRRQAQFFLDQRGRGLIGGSEYHQDHRPFRDLERMAGHAVRAVYMNCGAADLVAETGEPNLRAALNRLWRNMTVRQVYVSGGVGSRHAGESFGRDYELPNERAYTETCAAIASVMWNWRMLALDGDARYADAMETALYNGFLVGLSLDGTSYFYQNPLADDGTHRRQEWFDCACCPPNIARLLASIPGYLYTVSAEGAWVHLYAQGSASIPLTDGTILSLRQHTRYPWGGRVEIEVGSSGTFSLFLRIPGWCDAGASLVVNGHDFPGVLEPGSYAELRRSWNPGDTVHLDLPMPVRQVESHPYVAENLGRVALLRGPVLYCVEGADNPGLDPRDLYLPAGATFAIDHHPDLLGGVVALRGPARALPPGAAWEDHLYRPARHQPASPEGRPIEVIAIPYYAWANRGPEPMQVWLRSE